MRSVSWRLVAWLVAILIVIMAISSRARAEQLADHIAHGDADWIRQGNYRDGRNYGCCGEDDCRVVPEGAIEEILGGWRARDTGQVFLENTGGVHPSRDHQFWWCEYPTEKPHKRCIFHPVHGA